MPSCGCPTDGNSVLNTSRIENISRNLEPLFLMLLGSSNNCAYYTHLDDAVGEVIKTAPPGSFVYKALVKYLCDKRSASNIVSGINGVSSQG